MTHLGRVRVDGVSVELNFWYDQGFIWPREEYSLKGRLYVPSRVFSAGHTMVPEWMGETFEQAVEQVVSLMAIEAIAKPATQELMDQYTALTASGQFKPSV